jgi:hypothetical protein
MMTAALLLGWLAVATLVLMMASDYRPKQS